MTRSHSALVIGLLIVLCLVSFWLGLGSLGITDLDEGLYTAASREMALTGDFITPRVNGEPFFEKPPLLYWLSAFAIRIFSTTESSARLPSAIAATLLVALTFWFGSRRLSPVAALLGAAFLSLSPVMVAAGRLSTTDALLTLCVTLAIVAAEEATRAHRRRFTWFLVSACACGVGVLAKGAPAIVLPAITLGVWYFGFERRSLRPLLRIRSWAVILGMTFVIALIAFPWHMAALQANGRAFVDEYVVRQHLMRFQGGDVSHRAPFWFFVPGFLAGMFPWSLFTAAALCVRNRQSITQANQNSEGPSSAILPKLQQPVSTRTLLKTWFWVTFIIFSASGSKLISYILPLYPAAALLAGDYVAKLAKSPRAPRVMTTGGLAALVILVGLWLALVWPDPLLVLINRYSTKPVALSPDARRLLAACVLPLGITVGAPVAMLVWAHRPELAAGVSAAVMTAFVLVVLWRGVPIINQKAIGSLHALAAYGGRLVADGGSLIVAIGSPRRPSIFFYVPDRVLVEHRVHEVASPDDAAAMWEHARGRVLILTRGPSPTNVGGRTPRLLVAHRDYCLWSASPAMTTPAVLCTGR